MIFENREHAAQLLAKRLARFRGKRPLVLAIPRGAGPMGKILADALGGDLDVVLVHKLGAPGNPEFAIGSIDESGKTYLNGRELVLEVDDAYVNAEARSQLDRLRRRRALYTSHRRPLDPAGRIVIVVDDGIATGSTAVAALRSIRARRPARLVAATAVAPPETLARIRSEADEVECLQSPENFAAVGQFFLDFPQVTDQEVIDLLDEAHAARNAS